MYVIPLSSHNLSKKKYFLFYRLTWQMAALCVQSSYLFCNFTWNAISSINLDSFVELIE
jgi:hypothetical protein